MELTNENYYSLQADMEYMSYSQFKNFIECEAKALAEVKGEYLEPVSDALLQGSYVDAYFSGELEDFKDDHPELFKKDGTLLAKYDICNDAIKAIEEDETFKEMFYSGKAQTIVTGKIAEVPFKGKIDMLYDDKIVDMKFMKDVNDVWDDEQHRKVRFFLKYGYAIQAAIYQELYYQETGQRLPYYLAVVTKTSPVEKHVYQFQQEVLDLSLKLVQELAPRFQKIKEGKIQPNECGKCGYYHKNHKFNIFDIEEITKEDL